MQSIWGRAMHEIIVSDPETGERFRADESVRYFYEVRCGFLVEPHEQKGQKEHMERVNDKE